jgi:hypothetical protein
MFTIETYRVVRHGQRRLKYAFSPNSETETTCITEDKEWCKCSNCSYSMQSAKMENETQCTCRVQRMKLYAVIEYGECNCVYSQSAGNLNLYSELF